MSEVRRAWCAQCRYPDKAPFLFGTVQTGRGEGEEAARVALTAALAEVLPILPRIEAVIPGQVIFAPEGGP
jgi:hypothetical protein